MTDITLLAAVFQNVFEKEPNFRCFDDRLEMQKTVYLLREMGVTCGNYPFRWYKHGPYSQGLQNVMISSAPQQEPVSFSEIGAQGIGKLKNLLHVDHTGYSDADWMEALGSLHYLRKYREPTLDDRALLLLLTELKPNLSNEALNREALRQLCTLDLVPGDCA